MNNKIEDLGTVRYILHRQLCDSVRGLYGDIGNSQDEKEKKEPNQLGLKLTSLISFQ